MGGIILGPELGYHTGSRVGGIILGPELGVS
jgi:hypothetical protein